MPWMILAVVVGLVVALIEHVTEYCSRYGKAAGAEHRVRSLPAMLPSYRRAGRGCWSYPCVSPDSGVLAAGIIP
jgi:hypothetical protein